MVTATPAGDAVGETVEVSLNAVTSIELRDASKKSVKHTTQALLFLYSKLETRIFNFCYL